MSRDLQLTLSGDPERVTQQEDGLVLVHVLVHHFDGVRGQYRVAF